MTIIHIVMLKFRPDVGEENKNDTIRAMKSLKTLDCVKGHRLVVGGPSINTPPERSKGFEVVLLSLHEDMTALDKYRNSDEHQAITRTHIFPNTEDILRFDFEVNPEEDYMWISMKMEAVLHELVLFHDQRVLVRMDGGELQTFRLARGGSTSPGLQPMLRLDLDEAILSDITFFARCHYCLDLHLSSTFHQATMSPIIHWNSTPQRSEELCGLLQKYGVMDIIEWESISDLERLLDKDVILVNGNHGFSCAAIRQLTFRSVRLPEAYAVCDGPLKEDLFALKLSSHDLRAQLEVCHDLPTVAHDLAQQESMVSSTYEEFCSNSASAVGGSFSDSGIHRYFAKMAKGRGAQKLSDEIRMYQTLPDEIQDCYPQILFASRKQGTITMGTELKDFPNLRDLLLNNQLSVDDAARVLSTVLEFEYNKAFLKHKQPTPPGYIHDYHFHRAWRRLTISAEMDPVFSTLITTPWLEINGRRISNVPAMLNRLERDEVVVRRLDPGGVSPFIHGDFHPGNMLFDTNHDNFWLVDPRGYPVCDIYYDLGKLAQSTRSYYDLLHEGRHEATCTTTGDLTVINYQFMSPWAKKLYTDLDACLQPIIHRLLSSTSDYENVDLRIRFNEAIHLCSLMPFHIHPDAQPSVAIPIFAAGALRLAEIMDLLGIGAEECVSNHADGLERMAELGHVGWQFEG